MFNTNLNTCTSGKSLQYNLSLDTDLLLICILDYSKFAVTQHRKSVASAIHIRILDSQMLANLILFRMLMVDMQKLTRYLYEIKSYKRGHGSRIT